MTRGRWTGAEIAELRRRYPTESTDAIAADLGRGRAGVASKANEIGLRKAGNRSWTDDELEQIRRRYADDPAADIARDIGRSLAMVYYRAGQMGIKKSADFLERVGKRPRAPRKDSWTDEHLDELRRRYPHERTIDIAEDLGRSFNATNTKAFNIGIKKTEAYMREQHARLKEGGRKYRIKPGNVPANKGLRRPGWYSGRMRETQFKKGHKSNTEMQVGDCSIETKQKMWKRKMCMDCRGGCQWLSLPRYIWMMANGPIPPGHVVRVEGWDRNNPEPIEAVTLDRLTCIPKSKNMLRNSIHRYPKEVVDAVMQAGRLQREINKQEGRHGKKRRAKGKRENDIDPAGPPVRHAGGSARQR